MSSHVGIMTELHEEEEGWKELYVTVDRGGEQIHPTEHHCLDEHLGGCIKCGG